MKTLLVISAAVGLWRWMERRYAKAVSSSRRLYTATLRNDSEDWIHRRDDPYEPMIAAPRQPNPSVENALG